MINKFDVSKFVQDFSSGCSKAQIKEFNKGETITTYLVNRNQLCILISGSADLVRYDINRYKNCDREIFSAILFLVKFFMILIQIVNS